MIQVLRDSFKLKHYILVSRVFTDPSTTITSTKKQKVTHSILCLSNQLAVHCLMHSDIVQAQSKEPVIIYARPEDEFYHKHCSWSYTFPVTNRDIDKDELQPLRMVLAITPQKVTTAR